MYWVFGMLYFKLIDFTDIKIYGKLLRIFFYFVLMMACALQGGEYFVNDSYRANGIIVHFNISCAGSDGKGMKEMCTESAIQTTVAKRLAMLERDDPAAEHYTNFTTKEIEFL